MRVCGPVWRVIILQSKSYCLACGLLLPEGSSALCNEYGSVVCIGHDRPFNVGIRKFLTIRDLLSAGIDPVGYTVKVLGFGLEYQVITIVGDSALLSIGPVPVGALVTTFRPENLDDIQTGGRRQFAGSN
jgi:hypothetical protein